MTGILRFAIQLSIVIHHVQEQRRGDGQLDSLVSKRGPFGRARDHGSLSSSRPEARLEDERHRREQGLRLAKDEGRDYFSGVSGEPTGRHHADPLVDQGHQVLRRVCAC